jgi:hypothetical protein
MGDEILSLSRKMVGLSADDRSCGEAECRDDNICSGRSPVGIRREESRPD